MELRFIKKQVGQCEVYDNETKQLLLATRPDGSVYGSRENIELICRLKSGTENIYEFLLHVCRPEESYGEENRRSQDHLYSNAESTPNEDKPQPKKINRRKQSKQRG